MSTANPTPEIQAQPDPTETLTSSLITVQETADRFSNDMLNWLHSNTVYAASGLAAILGITLLLLLLRRGLTSLADRKQRTLGRSMLLWQVFGRLVRSTLSIFLLVVSGWIVAQFVNLPKGMEAGFDLGLTLMGLIQLGLWVRELILQTIERRLIRQGVLDAQAAVLPSALGVIRWMVNMAVTVVTALLLLDQLGVNVTTLVAGLGIGGLAIGLAAQGVMADLFSALSIVFDKPFVRGDTIAFGDKIGTVENVGLKTSRLRALSGEMMVVSNNHLLGQIIHNHKQLKERRILFRINVAYGITPEQIAMVPKLIREAVESQKNCRFDRSHLSTLGDSALQFETVYFFEKPEFALHMDAQQAIFLQILGTLGAQGISLAYPTQIVELKRTPPKAVPV